MDWTLVEWAYIRIEDWGLVEEAGEERAYGYRYTLLTPLLEELAKREGVTPLSRFTRNEKDLLEAFSEEAADDSDEVTREIYLSSRGDWFPASEVLASVRALLASARKDPDLVERYEEVTECGPDDVVDELECFELILVRAAEEGQRVRIFAPGA